MTIKKPIAVIGGGSFGTAIANLLASNQHPVRLWMRDPQQAQAINDDRLNPRYLKGVPVLDGVLATTDLATTITDCDLVFVALPSTALRVVLTPYAEQLSGKMLVSTTKGIEPNTFMLMSQILEDIAPLARVGVLSGPNLAREVAAHALTASVIASMPAATVLALSWAEH